jgi:CelD/BcsL family acetyltransferase involved in cellulose biosynthesis
MKIERLALERWHAFDREHAAPTFFARPAWANALQDAMPSLRAAPLYVRLGKQAFILPTVHAAQRRTPFREYIGFPLGGYTCVLDERGNAASLEQATAVVAEIAERVDHLRIFPWPLGPAVMATRAAQQPHETAVIDCADGFDAVIARMRGVTRRMVGQAMRRGVVCERAPRSALPTYYAMLEAASAHWPSGRPSLGYALLERVLHHGGEDAQLWFARVDGVPIAGGIVLFGSQELFFWSAAMDRAASAYRPSNALNFALLKVACERGLRWYNLGASEGLEGVSRFKDDLGATPIAYRELRVNRPMFALYERARAFVLRGQAC